MKTKDIKNMSKKELKDYINQNGFFFHIQCDKITTDEVNTILTDKMEQKVFRTGKEIPTGENIVVFKGIASQNYGKGEKSRNGYKYDQDGWDFSAYQNNPIILWQHETNYGGIGNGIAFWNDNAGNLNAIFFVDLDTLEERNAVQVKRGYVTAISTGAIAKEYMYEENDTGTRYTEQDAEEKFGYENVWRAMWGDSDVLTLVVTEAEMIENSLVTIGSNENAVAMQNAIGMHFKEVAETYKKNKIDINTPEVEEKKPEETPAPAVAEEEKPEVKTPETTEAEQTPAEVEEKKDSAEEAEQTPTEVTTTQEVEKQAETPATVEQAGDQSEAEQKPTPAPENDATLANALEKIEAQANEISELKKSNADNLAALDAFKDEVYETMEAFIRSHNDAVENLGEVNKVLLNARVSKGLPHILKKNAAQPKSPLAGLVETLKAKA